MADLRQHVRSWSNATPHPGGPKAKVRPRYMAKVRRQKLHGNPLRRSSHRVFQKPRSLFRRAHRHRDHARPRLPPGLVSARALRFLLACAEAACNGRHVSRQARERVGRRTQEMRGQHVVVDRGRGEET